MARRSSTPGWEEYLARFCWSDWEGCACNLPKHHDGLHVCTAEGCDSTWTDEQEIEWHRSLGFRK